MKRGLRRPEQWHVHWTLQALAFARLSERFPQLVEDPQPLPDDVPAPVVEVIRAALDRNPGHRPLPSELADALEPVVAGLPTPRLTFRARR